MNQKIIIGNEKACLSYILRNPDTILELPFNLFLTEEGRALWDACVKLYRRNMPLTNKKLLALGIHKEFLVDVRRSLTSHVSWGIRKRALEQFYIRNRLENLSAVGI